MYEQAELATTVDLPVLFADLIVDTGLLDRLCASLGGALKALPSRLAAWFGPELHTPANSPAPSVTFGDGALWNGVVFIEASEPAFWLVVKAGPDRRRRGFDSQRQPAEPFGSRAWAQDSGSYWEEPYREPREREPWRR